MPQVVCHGLTGLSHFAHHIFIPHITFPTPKSQNPNSQPSECVENNLSSLFRDKTALHSRGNSLTDCSVLRREIDEDTL